jgi:hypothetical protein
MKKVTRDIDPSSAQDLLERVPRACLSYAGEHGPRALPAGLVWQEGRYLVRISEKGELLPNPGQEAVLLVDEGIYYFELRAIYIRGNLQPVEAPPGGQMGGTWYELIPVKTVAWDYGKMREEGG